MNRLIHIFANATVFWRFIGEDPDIIRDSPTSERIRFSFMGIIVGAVVIITGISITYGVYELLESYYFGLPLGLFAAFFVLTLYIFIIYTLTRNVLPTDDGSKIGRWASLTLRIVFLAALGFIASQPVEYYFFSDEVNKDLSEQIAQTIRKKNTQMNIDFTRFINEAEQTAVSKQALIAEVAHYKKKKQQDLRNFAEFQYTRNFFIRKMVLMDTSLWYIWPFSAFFIVLFLSPIWIKRMMSLNRHYYQKKFKIENEIILSHHKWFVATYDQILMKQFPKENLHWSSIYLNPPYNTQLRTEFIHHPETEFENWLLSESLT